MFDLPRHLHIPAHIPAHTPGHRLVLVVLAALLALVLAVFPAVRVGGAERGVPVVVVLETMTLPDVQARTEALVTHLARLGLAAGVDLDLVVLNANKDVEAGARLLADALETRDVDVVVTIATLASQAARRVLGPDDPPQVFFFVSDPIGAGLIETIGHPTHAGITGIQHNLPVSTSVGAVLRLLEPVRPDDRAIRIGVLHTDYPSSLGNLRDLRAYAETHERLEIIPLGVTQLSLSDGRGAMLAQAREAMEDKRGDYDYLWIAEGPLARDIESCAALVAAAPRPVVFAPTRSCVADGALTAVGTDAYSDGYEAALVVRAILEGETAGQIPVMSSRRFFQGINTETAKTLGISIPDDAAADATLYPGE